MNVLFGFYSFRTAATKWCNYVGSQRRIQDAVNILLNGSKKYDKDRRKRQKKTKKGEKETDMKKTAYSRSSSLRWSKGISMNTFIKLHLSLKKKHHIKES